MYISGKLCQWLSLKWNLYFKHLLQPLDIFIFMKVIIRRIQNILLNLMFHMESLMHFECSESVGMTNAVTYDSQ